MSLGKVGSKGELFPPKKLREEIGLQEGKQVLFRNVKGKLIVEVIYSAEELLSKPSKVKISISELKRERNNFIE